MFPISLDLGRLTVFVVGSGEVVTRRLALLDGAGARQVVVFAPEADDALAAAAGQRLRRAWPQAAELGTARVVLVAGLPLGQAVAMAEAARQAGALVNVEDVTEYCDFHLPALVRRGDLTIAVGTGGRSPALARRLRQHLDRSFGPEWQGRLDELASSRQVWRGQGVPPSEISARSFRLIEEKGWL